MSKKRKYGVIALFLGLALLCQPGVQAQTSVLGLNQAIEQCLQNSKQLKVSKAKIEQATAQLKQALDNRLPDAKVSGSYLWLPKPNIKLKTDDNSSGETMAQPSQAVYGMATVNMPLYAGLKIRYGIESAELMKKAAETDVEYDKETVVSNAIAAYSNLYKSQVAVALVRENLAQSQQRDKDFSNMEKNGLLARNDLLKAQLQTSNIELTLVNAENNLKLAMVSLNLMMGQPEQNVIVADSTSFQQQYTLATVDEYEQQAFQNRKDMTALELRRKAAEASVKATKGELYPSIGLTGGYVAAYIPNLLTATNVVNLGVGVQYNIGSLWKTKAKVAQAQANEKELVARQEMLTDEVRMDINRAYQNYLATQKKIEVEEKSVINATENYRITKNKHDNNLVTTTELLDANVALLQSKINLQEAKADIVVAYNTLLEKVGVLAGNQQKN
ncbi:outer membrane protein TolC [Filimonas zeae]|uniref:Transporter n=1 Tax=Filimonas zeae TaxID=1737353 RepID=A0A917J3H4_9BACT|nr:TolC family protein [Filimonas zeae]MDR6341030.1 outer membrane protein TolC [Filimonas zeae]GGH77506.1 transporter [Filimonas zeae]